MFSAKSRHVLVGAARVARPDLNLWVGVFDTELEEDLGIEGQVRHWDE